MKNETTTEMTIKEKVDAMMTHDADKIEQEGLNPEMHRKMLNRNLRMYDEHMYDRALGLVK